jgi:molybdopterin converting factor small subunit
LFATPAFGQEPGAFSKVDSNAINDMLERYSHAFQTRDYERLREYVQAPFVTFPGELKVFATMEAVMERYRNEREPLEERGYDRSKYVETRITGLAPDRALVNKTYRRFRKDGTLLEEKAAIYLVTKVSGSWKLCGSIGQMLPLFGKTF